MRLSRNTQHEQRELSAASRERATASKGRRLRWLAPALACLLGAGVFQAVPAQAPAQAADGARLLGVNRAGTEYVCVQGWGIFDGPSDATSAQAMAKWNINTVRVPLNEDCWLGINGVAPAYSGSNYRQAISNYVGLLNGAGLTAVLDLHWSAPGSTLATKQELMADADHSPAFWSSVAAQFKDNPKVAFDLFNEPHDISWSCWRDGCTTSSGWQTAGMQSLVNAVRGAGATQQQVIATGLAYGNDLTGWLANRPNDPAGRLSAGFHVYNFNACVTTGCWDSTVAPVAAQVPVFTGEVGENDCATGFLNSYMAWADAHAVSYLGWAWNTANCSSFPALISNYDGTPTSFGVGLRDHLASLSTGSGTTAAVQAGFEDGSAQGWQSEWGGSAVRNTSLVASAGGRSLEVDVPANGYPAIAARTGLTGLATGRAVSYRVFRPAGAPPIIVEPFVEDGGYTVHKAASVNLNAGWNTVSFTVPSVDRVTVLGLQIDNPQAWAGQLALDDVSW